MEYLYSLQQLREASPAWINETLLSVSEFIAGAGGLALMALIYWCINKRAGIFVMMNFSLAYVFNTVIKNLFRVERPFNRDTRLKPYVPATGYSFPSGHTMLATGFYGGIAVWQRKRKWLAAICVFMVFLTAFTRNWLGAHTLQDVLVGIVCSAAVIIINGYLLEWVEKKPNRDIIFFGAAMLLVIIFCLLYPSSLKVAGIYGGVMLGWFIERRFIRFENSGSILYRIIMFAVGIGIIALLHKLILPKLFASLDGSWANMLNYFITFLAVSAGWPAVIKLTGKWFKKAPAKQS